MAREAEKGIQPEKYKKPRNFEKKLARETDFLLPDKEDEEPRDQGTIKGQ
jgi:hypothetical protein